MRFPEVFGWRPEDSEWNAYREKFQAPKDIHNPQLWRPHVFSLAAFARGGLRSIPHSGHGGCPLDARRRQASGFVHGTATQRCCHGPARHAHVHLPIRASAAEADARPSIRTGASMGWQGHHHRFDLQEPAAVAPHGAAATMPPPERLMR
jgi:hypothetical protein